MCLAFDYGAALSYLIIAADTSTEVVRTCLGGGFEGDRSVCILALSFGAMLPLCLLRDIR
jgi:amino acid permease